MLRSGLYIPCCLFGYIQVRKRKWENYSSGEELFGLQVTSYPELELTEKEVSMLDRLYRSAWVHAGWIWASKPVEYLAVDTKTACLERCTLFIWCIVSV